MRGIFIARFVVFCLVFLTSGFLIFSETTTAQDLVSGQDTRFKVINEFDNAEEVPNTRFTSNVTCNNRSVVLRPEKSNLGYTHQSEIRGSDCMVDTIFGSIGGSYFVRNGTTLGGKLNLRSSKEFLPAANNLKSAVLASSTSPVSGGIYISTISNFATSVATIELADGRIEHFLITEKADIKDIKDAKNQRLTAHYDTMSFSNNGEWMLFDSPYYGHVRLNVLTGETLSFGEPSNYNRANPNYRMAISADGKYAVVGSRNLLKVYNLENCSDQVGALSYLKKCQFKDLEPERKAQVNFGLSPGYIRFTKDNVFTYITSELVGGKIVYKKIQVSEGDQPEFGMQYLGLGDSFASGEGAFEYKTFTDTEDNMCHLSLTSYPYLIGSILEQEKYESVACSGAKAIDVAARNSTKYEGQFGNYVPSQDIDKQIIDGLIPGYLTQESFVKKHIPEVVSISIGGNDIAFGDKLKSCIVGSAFDQTCFDTFEERKAVLLELENLVPELTKTYEALKNNNSRVYVLGYPKMIEPGGNCANNVKLNYKETYFADRLTVLLNDAIEVATKKAGVFYVDVEDTFEGSRLCEANSDAIHFHGITEGNDSGPLGLRILGRESFHPKKEAHEIYSSKILISTQNLTAPMPYPDTSAEYPKLADDDDFLKDFEPNGMAIYIPKYANMLKDRISSGENYEVSLPTSITGFNSFQDINVEIHSNPVPVGEYKADENGDLKISIEVPEITPGFHSLHIFGKNSAGQLVDFYDYVLIGQSNTDFDGDGTPDSEEGCVFLDDDSLCKTKNTDEILEANFVSNPPTPVDNENSQEENKEESISQTESINSNDTSSVAVQPTTFDVDETNIGFAENTPDNVPRVLSENSTIDPNEEIAVNEPSIDPVNNNNSVNDPSVYLWTLAAAAVTFVIIVVTILYLRKR